MKKSLILKNNSDVLVELAGEYRSLSSLNEPKKQTIDSYNVAIKAFVEFLAGEQNCLATDVNLTIVTPPQVLIFFIAKVNDGFKRNTIKLWECAIKYLYKQNNLPCPTNNPAFKEAFHGLLKKFTSKKVQQATALLTNDIIRMTETRLSDNELIERRDKVIIIIGFTGGFRTDELVTTRYRPGGDCDSVQDISEGFVIEVLESKTDYRKVFIPNLPNKKINPAAILSEWLNIVKVGQLFQRISKSGNMHGSLSDTSVRRMLKERARLAKLKNWQGVSGHTLRRSFDTVAYLNGASIANIGTQTGQSKETVLKYISDIDFITKNPANILF